MRLSLARFPALLMIAIAVVVGCRSLYNDAGGGGAGGPGSAASSPDAFGSAQGFFAAGSHDVPGGTPVVVQEETDQGADTASHFRAIQVDPPEEDTAGPKFLIPVDMNGDGLMDLVSGWNQSQPVQLHLQQRDAEGKISFRAATLGGTYPIGIIAGVEVADMDEDGRLDVVVLVKHTGQLAFCLNDQADTSGFTGVIVILFGPSSDAALTDGDAWEEVVIQDSESSVNSRWGRASTVGRGIDFPEDGGYTSLAVGEIDGVNGPDIVITSNVPEPECNTGQNAVELWLNPGANVRDGSPQNITTNGPPALTVPPSFWYPIWIDIDAPVVKDSAVLDVDGDGDLDILSAYSNASTLNVRWYRNPLIEQGQTAVSQGTVFLNGNRALWASQWERRPIGTLDGDVGKMTLGDMDGDGFTDVMVRAADRKVVEWFRHPTGDPLEPIFPPPDAVPGRFDFPWQVYTLVDYPNREPMGIAIGDLTGDGQAEAVVAVGGALEWFDSAAAPAGLYSQWGGTFIVDDTKAQGTTADPNDPDFEDTATLINEVIITDLDGDGFNDIVGTLDRRVDSGLAEDTIIWFRNTLGDEGHEVTP